MGSSCTERQGSQERQVLIMISIYEMQRCIYVEKVKIGARLRAVLKKCMERDVIIEDTLGMFKEFISSQTVRKNYYPPDNNIESD